MLVSNLTRLYQMGTGIAKRKAYFEQLMTPLFQNYFSLIQVR